MANFGNAFKITMGHEGGYANDPDDPGRETYRGISRRHHPNWAGWEIIDELKILADIEGVEDIRIAFKNNVDLDECVLVFYREHYWDRITGDEVQNQQVAEELFDIAVNMGVHKAVTFLQGALNLLNRKQQSYPDIAEDGVIGAKTLKVLSVYLQTDSTAPHELLVIMNLLQGMHYITIMRRHPTLEKYAHGWLGRVTIERR